MINARIEGTTRVLGQSQGFRGLCVRDAVEEVLPGKLGPTMTSAWEPTPQELAALNAGGKVYLRICASAHPPMALWCEPPHADVGDA